jgi:hypothetical protein
LANGVIDTAYHKIGDFKLNFSANSNLNAKRLKSVPVYQGPTWSYLFDEKKTKVEKSRYTYHPLTFTCLNITKKLRKNPDVRKISISKFWTEHLVVITDFTKDLPIWIIRICVERLIINLFKFESWFTVTNLRPFIMHIPYSIGTSIYQAMIRLVCLFYYNICMHFYPVFKKLILILVGLPKNITLQKHVPVLSMLRIRTRQRQGQVLDPWL